MTYSEFNRGTLKILPLEYRKHKMTNKDIFNLDDEIPAYDNPNLENLAKSIVEARKNGKQVIWMMGAHTIRRGNSRFIIDLIKKGIITHIATNGACVVHDFELALIGATAENVEKYIQSGGFGNWQETGYFINKAVKDGYDDGLGFGESVGRMISNSWVRYQAVRITHKELSIFAAAFRKGIPITVHKLIGGDITDQHPSAVYEALGGASGRDFLIFSRTVSMLDGGVFLNIGSAVTGPEVYLKALSMARNIAKQKGGKITNFTTAVFDMVDLKDWEKEDDILTPHYYFRPKKTVLIRTVKDKGRTFYIKGDLKATVPNLYKRIIKNL
jgi:hypothetical protein